jgi:hypothetical protein
MGVPLSANKGLPVGWVVRSISIPYRAFVLRTSVLCTKFLACPAGSRGRLSVSGLGAGAGAGVGVH